MKKALVTFSGGLDSLIVIKLLQKQHINVTAIHFTSCFFNKTQKITNFANLYGFKIIFHDFSTQHIEIVKKPKFGYGKNLNPCIDCHLLMLQTCAYKIKSGEYDFLATGEVLAQRPFSQNYDSFAMMEEETGLKGLILRPLSAKCLDETIPEKEGWVDRNQFYDINGKRRDVQLKLIEEFNLTEFETPAGGCVLTDNIYSKNIRIIKKDKLMNELILFKLLQFGRFKKYSNGVYIFIGRNKEDNEKLLEFKNHFSHFISEADTKGPNIGIYGHATDNTIQYAKELFHRYSKAKGEGTINVLVDGKVEKSALIFNI